MKRDAILHKINQNTLQKVRININAKVLNPDPTKLNAKNLALLNESPMKHLEIHSKMYILLEASSTIYALSYSSSEHRASGTDDVSVLSVSISLSSFPSSSFMFPVKLTSDYKSSYIKSDGMFEF